MKKSITVAAVMIAFILLFQTTQAKILRVGYFGTPVTNVDYTSLQPALDAAARGDTIQLYPGTWSGSISKRLVLVGKGYFTEGGGSNLNLQVLQGDVHLTTLNMYSGSDSSVIEGIDGG